MNRPWRIWMIFTLCGLAGFAALVWVSLTLIEIDRRESTAAARAAIEENVRLALWRMDSALLPILGRENARPPGEYRPFYPVTGAVTPSLDPLPPQSVLLPSPLLESDLPMVRLHFELSPSGQITTPYSGPRGSQQLHKLQSIATPANILASAPPIEPEPVRDAVPVAEADKYDAPAFEPQPPAEMNQSPMQQGQLMQQRASVAQQQELSSNEFRQRMKVSVQSQRMNRAESKGYAAVEPSGEVDALQMAAADVGASEALRAPLAPLAPSAPAAPSAPRPSAAPAAAPAPTTAPTPMAAGAAAPQPPAAKANVDESMQLADADRHDRGAEFRREITAERKRADGLTRGIGGALPGMQALAEAEQPVLVGDMKPVWMGGELMLLRRVATPSGEVVQGVWLDWDAMRKWLLSEVQDLLPAAELRQIIKPIKARDQNWWAYSNSGRRMAEPVRALAVIPALLVPHSAEIAVVGISPDVRLSLIVTWACLIAATAAVAMLLWGALALSERRGAFVSAVTHELRTPLTTFRLYTQMLQQDMVTDEARRRSYLQTLGAEAERLSHLVENVLSYARLERGRNDNHREAVDASTLIDRMVDRLGRRAEQAAMTFTCDVDESASGATVITDPGAVERIIFNLVDNACKYAAKSEDRTIRLHVSRDGDRVVMRVRDHGPGISGEARRRLFEPFSKSAHEAAHSAPGVGLGLALSRRLARRLGGELVIEPCDGGSCFALSLPIAGGARQS